MITKLLANLLTAGVLLQFFPADAGELEKVVLLHEGTSRRFDVLEARQVIARLPLSNDAPQAPRKIHPESMGVVTTAQSAAIVDQASGTFLFEKNPDQTRSIGSITKLMTAYVFLETQPNLDDVVALTSEDFRSGGVLHIPLEEEVTIQDLLKASLISSDNSATAALVRLSGMSQGNFVARMNEMAAQMGLLNTSFADETGLSADNRSNVRDLAVLFRALLDHPVIGSFTQQSSAVITAVSGRAYFLESTDELLGSFVNRDPYKILLAKTGYLPEAGYCLGTVFSHQGKDKIIVVVLGAQTLQGRFQDVKSLAVWAYENFDW